MSTPTSTPVPKHLVPTRLLAAAGGLLAVLGAGAWLFGDVGLREVGPMVFVVGLSLLGFASSRRTERLRHERAAHHPVPVLPSLQDLADPPLARDRWAPAADLPPGVPRSMAADTERALLILLAVMTVPGMVLLVWDLPATHSLGPAVDGGLAAAAGVALAVLLARLALRSVRWSRDGLMVRGYLTTRRFPWSDIDHVTADASETNNRSGHYWVLTPALVLATGETVLLGVFSLNDGGMFRIKKLGLESALAMYDTLDAWLASANVPVDVAYESLRGWRTGEVTTQQAVALSDSPPSQLHPVTVSASVAAVAPPGAPVTAPVSPVTASKPAGPSLATARPRLNLLTLLLIMGGTLLLAIPALLLVLGVPAMTYGMLTGEKVDVQVVSHVGNDCAIVELDGYQREWSSSCMGGWQTGDIVHVVVSGGRPETWVGTLTAWFVVSVLCLPGLALILAGVVIRRRARRRLHPQPPTTPVVSVVSS